MMHGMAALKLIYQAKHIELKINEDRVTSSKLEGVYLRMDPTKINMVKDITIKPENYEESTAEFNKNMMDIVFSQSSFQVIHKFVHKETKSVFYTHTPCVFRPIQGYQKVLEPQENGVLKIIKHHFTQSRMNPLKMITHAVYYVPIIEENLERLIKEFKVVREKEKWKE